MQAHDVIATLNITANIQDADRGAGRNTIMDEPTLREIYALAFEAVVAAPAWGR